MVDVGLNDVGLTLWTICPYCLALHLRPMAASFRGATRFTGSTPSWVLDPGSPRVPIALRDVNKSGII